jgi:hypothetical protein
MSTISTACSKIKSNLHTPYSPPRNLPEHIRNSSMKFELLCLHVHRSPGSPSFDSSVAARYWPGRMQIPFGSTKSTMRGWGSSFRSSKGVHFQQLPPPFLPRRRVIYSCRRRDTCAATISLTFTIQGLMHDNTQYTPPNRKKKAALLSVWTSGHWSLKSLSQHA